ncbi:MAG: glycosyltransferase, partial [Actinomycetota bacterium]|nr:glycosyltransferase [Actinomycetota bacterium]
MNVLHVINNLGVGGAELHLLQLSRSLKEQGIHVEVASLRQTTKGNRLLREDFEAAHIPVHHLHAEKWYDLTFPLRLRRLVRGISDAILHTHLPRADLAGGFRFPLYRDTPWVCSVHDIYSNSWSGRKTLPIFDLIWRRADAVVAISDAVRTWLVQERRVPREKVHVIHYGIDPHPFQTSSSDLRAEWDLGARPLIGCLAR